MRAVMHDVAVAILEQCALRCTVRAVQTDPVVSCEKGMGG
jgi:hypothetical protein